MDHMPTGPKLALEPSRDADRFQTIIGQIDEAKEIVRRHRAELEQARKSWRDVWDGRARALQALGALVAQGDPHEDSSCPMDDTCECELAALINEALRGATLDKWRTMASLRAEGERVTGLMDAFRADRDNCLDVIAGLTTDRATARAEVSRLRGAVEDFVRRCTCGGTGRVDLGCGFCGDSTYDHECETRLVTCGRCDTLRAALAPEGEGAETERERAAHIAETHPLHPSTQTGERQRWLRESIAAAIRGGVAPEGEGEREKWVEPPCTRCRLGGQEAGTLCPDCTVEPPVREGCACGSLVPQCGGDRCIGAGNPAPAEPPVSNSSWCPQCGPHVQTDEDGCCAACGCDAIGAGADQALALLEETPEGEGELPGCATCGKPLADTATVAFDDGSSVHMHCANTALGIADEMTFPFRQRLMCEWAEDPTPSPFEPRANVKEVRRHFATDGGDCPNWCIACQDEKASQP